MSQADSHENEPDDAYHARLDGLAATLVMRWKIGPPDIYGGPWWILPSGFYHHTLLSWHPTSDIAQAWMVQESACSDGGLTEFELELAALWKSRDCSLRQWLSTAPPLARVIAAIKSCEEVGGG